jgi:hypothetical protein
MSSELEGLKQRITELEAKNAKLEAENVEIAELRKENTDLRNKLSVSDAEIAELKRSNIEFLRANKEYNERRDAENVKLKATIEELKSENVELRDRVIKVEQNQLRNDSKGNNTPNDNNPNNNSSNFNLGAVHHEKSPQDKETDDFLNKEHKKIVSEDIRRRNKEKKLSKAEQASSSLCEPSDTGCSTSEKIQVSNPVTRISARAPLPKNSHRKKGAENISQMISDGIQNDSQSQKCILGSSALSASGNDILLQ